MGAYFDTPTGPHQIMLPAKHCIFIFKNKVNMQHDLLSHVFNNKHNYNYLKCTEQKYVAVSRRRALRYCACAEAQVDTVLP